MVHGSQESQVEHAELNRDVTASRGRQLVIRTKGRGVRRDASHLHNCTSTFPFSFGPHSIPALDPRSGLVRNHLDQ